MFKDNIMDNIYGITQVKPVIDRKENLNRFQKLLKGAKGLNTDEANLFTEFTPVTVDRPTQQFQPLEEQNPQIPTESQTEQDEQQVTPETIDNSTQRLIEAQQKAQDIMNGTLDFKQDNTVSMEGNQKQLLSDTIDKLYSVDLSLKYKKDYLMKLAASESRFKLNATNSASSALGWFQFTNGTRETIMPGVSRTQFANSPEIQILAASKLYDKHLKDSKASGVYKIAKSKNFSDQDIVSAYWLSPGMAKDYFLNNNSTGHDDFGTSIPKKIMQVRKIKKDWNA